MPVFGVLYRKIQLKYPDIVQQEKREIIFDQMPLQQKRARHVEISRTIAAKEVPYVQIKAKFLLTSHQLASY